jgi:hypothetical protein
MDKSSVDWKWEARIHSFFKQNYRNIHLERKKKGQTSDESWGSTGFDGYTDAAG